MSEQNYITPEAMEIMMRYPSVFGSPPWPAEDSMLGWGFTCGPGWFPILDRLFSQMDVIRTEDSLENIKVIQVKEKFGGLRVYVRGGNARVGALIHAAEDECFHICENCSGATDGVRSVGGYLTNICDKCLAKRQEPNADET